jgi:hypothetical protein
VCEDDLVAATALGAMPAFFGEKNLKTGCFDLFVLEPVGERGSADFLPA